MKIGSFTQDEDGNLSGRVSGLGIGSIPILMQPEVSRKGDPFFKLIAEPLGDAYEIGVAFPKQKAGQPYHSVSLDSPILPTPINAAMFFDQSTGMFNLVWDRQAAQAPKADVKADASNQSQATKQNKYPTP